MAVTYNHAYTFAVEIKGSTNEEAEDVTGAQLRAALLARITSMTDDEVREACDAPYDTFEED
jgi:hypothetical protein